MRKATIIGLGSLTALAVTLLAAGAARAQLLCASRTDPGQVCVNYVQWCLDTGCQILDEEGSGTCTSPSGPVSYTYICWRQGPGGLRGGCNPVDPPAGNECTSACENCSIVRYDVIPCPPDGAVCTLNTPSNRQCR
jgi:hypothetical protein